MLSLRMTVPCVTVVDMAGEEVRATLRGANAELGAVRARDIARLITGMESAVAAAAYAALGKPRRSATGRHRRAIEAASQLRFRAVEAGSVVAVLGLPVLDSSTDSFGFEIDDLAGAAIDRLMASFEQSDEEVDPVIARALADLGSELAIGERYDELLLTTERTDARRHLNPAARERMMRLSVAPLDMGSDVLAGTLREADFDKRTARLRMPTGEAVTVAFPDDLEDTIQKVLRSPASFEGIVTVDAKTATARRVEVRRISRPDPLPFDSDEFWLTPPSVSELAEQQGVGPATFEKPFGSWSEEEKSDIRSALSDLNT